MSDDPRLGARDRETSSLEDEETLAADPDATLAKPHEAAPSDLPESIGQYRVVRRLGEGGMGIVFEAEQQNPRRLVALKVIRGGEYVDDAHLRMFQREVATLARLDHPHIAGIYESGRTEDGQHYFAMELVRGETLSEWIEKRPKAPSGGLSPAELRLRLQLFRQVADAVHYAHQRGVIHRDLKPSNLIVSASGELSGGTLASESVPAVKILDFGLARITDTDVAAATRTTEIGVIKGTLAYMSPEQARGVPEEIDIRTDVYALGVVLYEMLTGRLPIDLQRTSLVEAVRVICEQKPRPLRGGRARRFDTDLETIVAKALEKEVSRRYQSAGALAEDVARYLASQPITARPASTGYLLRKLVERNKLATGFSLALLIVLAGFGIWMSVLYVRAVRAESAALEAADRSEASKLLVLGQLELESNPTGALAYATKSLEFADSPEVRLFALRALSSGPMATFLAGDAGLAGAMARARFSHDGKWMALEGATELGVVSSDGATRLLLGSFPPTGGLVSSQFSQQGDELLGTKGGDLRIWSVPEFVEIVRRAIPVPEGGGSYDLVGTEGGYFVYTFAPSGMGGSDPVITVLSAKGEPGPMRHLTGSGAWPHIDPSSRWLGFYAQGGREVLLRSLADWEEPTRLVGLHTGVISSVRFHPDGQTLAAVDGAGEVRLWSSEPPSREPLWIQSGAPEDSTLLFDSTGKKLAAFGTVAKGNLVRVWYLTAPVEAQPVSVLSPGPNENPSFSPDGQWLTTSHRLGHALWLLSRAQPMVLSGTARNVADLAFTPDGRHLVSSDWAPSGELREWDLRPGGRSRLLASFERGVRRVAVDPEGRYVVASVGDQVLVVPLGEGPIRSLDGAGQFNVPVALDLEGRRAAAAALRGPTEGRAIRIWDLESGQVQVLGAGEAASEEDIVVQSDLRFLPSRRLVSVGEGGLRLWNTDTGTFEVLGPSAEHSQLMVFGGGRSAAYVGEEDIAAITDLETRSTRSLPSHGPVWPVVVDSTGQLVVTGDGDGIVRVGSIEGEQPHLLLGHEAPVSTLAISPDGGWIASGSADGTIRIWPMPDLSEPPLHTLPHKQLLAKLENLTNLRAVEDAGSPTGWRLEVGPFPGWEVVPTW